MKSYAEYFLSLFKEAVRAQLRSNGPVGVSLSGGLDSSSIVSTAQILYQTGVIPNKGLETFSIVFDELPCDERHYIDKVVHRLNLKANYFIYEQNISLLDIEQIRQYPDIGYSAGLLSCIPVLKDAQQKGIRIMLYGLGGDDLMSAGFDYLTDFLIQGKIHKYVGQLWRVSNLYSISPFYSFLKTIFKTLILQPIRRTQNKLREHLRVNRFPPWINDEYLKKAEMIERLKPSICSIQFPTRSQQWIYEYLRYGWDNNVGHTSTEGFPYHFGVENRFPFFDRRLVEFLLAIPEEQRWRNGWSKAILRQAMSGIVPETIIKRKNTPGYSCGIDLEFKYRQAHKVENLIRNSVIAKLE